MKAVIQRVKDSEVRIDGKIISRIDKGLNILLGIDKDDSKADADHLADKIINMRIFEDNNGKMNCSLRDVDGQILVVPNFTLSANCRRGNRPDFSSAEKPDLAKPLFEYFCKRLSDSIFTCTGVFGADMMVNIHNDGPVTIILDSSNI